MKLSRKSYIYMALEIVLFEITVAFIVSLGAILKRRNSSEFSQNEWYLLAGLIAATVACVIFAIFFAYKLKREINGKGSDDNREKPGNKIKLVYKKGLIIYACSLILEAGMIAAGILLRRWIPNDYFYLMYILLVSASGAILLMSAISGIMSKIYLKKKTNMRVAEIQKYLIEQRKVAKEMSFAKYSFLQRQKRIIKFCPLAVAILASVIGVCGTAAFEGTFFQLVFELVSLVLLMSAFSRIKFRDNKSVFSENKSYVSEEEYPVIYSLAYKAQKALGCKGKIQIAFISGNDAGIADIDGVYSVQIGTTLLGILSEDEIYSVLLHEFSHVSGENAKYAKELSYYSWLSGGCNPHFLWNFTYILYRWVDVVYVFEYNIFSYAVSIINESEADRAMAEYGDPEVSASALVKLKYSRLYEWEDGVYDFESFYESETLSKGFLSKDIERLKSAVNERKDFWNEIINSEILPRNASHPTTRMRLDMLGVDKVQTVDSVSSGKFLSECDKAINYVEDIIYENAREEYAESRETYYCNPKERIEEWKESGSPVIAEEYADVISDLRTLGRVSEAEKLCERAINELPDDAKNYAYFIKGQLLLRRFDPAGIDFIYKAVENNSNYIEEGLDVLGEFLCLTGRNEELDIYREKATELAQKNVDEYEELSRLNKKDKLSGEHLPDDLFQNIMSYIRSVDEDKIDKIYLVRKEISQELSTSVFVIKLIDDITDNDCNRIMHKIFSMLDTCSDHQFSLFDYRDVSKVGVEAVPGSLVYQRAEENT